MPEENLEDELRKLIREAEQSSDETPTSRETTNDKCLDGRLGESKNIEPTYFFNRNQIKENVYEYVESKDFYAEKGHKIDLSGKTVESKPSSDKELRGVSVVFRMDDGHDDRYYADETGGAIISGLKLKAIEKARRFAKSRGYDIILLENSNTKWDIVELKSRFSFSGLSMPYFIRYGVTVVAEFYKKK